MRSIVVRAACCLCWIAGLAWIGFVCSRTVGATEYTVTPADHLPEITAKLQAGDTLTLKAGTYAKFHLTFKDRHGREDAWITVRGEPGQQVVLTGVEKKRFFTVDGCGFFRFQNLEITAGGWDAFKFFGVSHDILVEDCYLHGLGGGGINCSGIEKMTRLTVRHCHIAETGGNGEGMYLGQQDGKGKSVFDSVFEYNLVHDTGGDQGDGIELNEGGLGNIIRHNVVFNTNYPCIFIENRATGPVNRVVGNICWNSNNETMQINGNAEVRDNQILGGRMAYALALKNVEQRNNRQYAAGEITPAEMLKRGLAMLRENNPDSAASRAAGLAGDGFKSELAPRQLAEADGGKNSAADLAERIGRVRGFHSERATEVRQDAARRIAELFQDHTGPTLFLPIRQVLTRVQATGADAEHGLTVTAQPEKTTSVIPWSQIDDNMLARILIGTATSTGMAVTAEDRMRICCCLTLGGWSYQLNGHLSALQKSSPAQYARFQARLEAMLTEPLPPSEPRAEKKQRAPTPPTDLAPGVKTGPVNAAFAIEPAHAPAPGEPAAQPAK